MADQDSSRLQESLLAVGGSQQQQQQQQQQQRQGLAATSSPYGSFRNQPSSFDKAKKICWWCVVIFTVVLVFLLLSLKLFLFKPISKGPPKLDNSTAMEPNTHTHYRLLMEGPRNRVQSLVGTTLWTYRIPIPTHPRLSVAAVGLYVERAEGKRRLRRFQGREMTDELFEQIKEVISRGGMTETLRFVMAITPPSGRMLEWWDDYTRPILEKLCPEKAEAEFKSFSEFFPDPFQKEDDFSFERREGEELYGYRKGQDRSKATRIAGSCMARALFEAQLEQQKSALLNLFDDFFER